MLMEEVANIISGTPQFRISEASCPDAPEYTFYAQAHLEDDLRGLATRRTANVKRVRTFDSVETVSAGDVVFSLLSGTSAVVLPEHEGYLLTQNYVRLVPANVVDRGYLVYLLNEHSEVRHQLRLGQQGSITMKYTLGQLKTLRLPALPPLGRQMRIGELYLDVKKLDALKRRVSAQEAILTLEAIREVNRSCPA